MMLPMDKATFGPWAVVMGAFFGIGKEFAWQLASLWDQPGLYLRKSTTR
jgi:hypothetical protein